MDDLIHSPNLIGHDDAIKQISEAFKSGRMPHAWLITGIEGIGKSTLAFHMAHQALSGGKNKVGHLDMNDRAAKLIVAEAHPDLLIIRPEVDDKSGELRNEIIKDDALKAAPFLHKTASHGGWRVVIIDEAHHLNRSSMNAVLKILEEPPSRTLILITVTTPGSLLPTVRSRCRVLNLTPLSDENLRKILVLKKPDLAPEDLDKVLKIAQGSIGFALKILETETLPLFKEVIEIIENRNSFDLARLHKLTDQISRKADTQSYEVLTTLLVEHLRSSVHNQATTDLALGRLDVKIKLWDNVQSIFNIAGASNLDRKLAFINAVTSIRSAS